MMQNRGLQLFHFIIISSLLFGLSFQLNAAVIYVNPNANGNNDGSSWQHAFESLHSALGSASPGDELRLAGGNYYVNMEDPGETFKIDVSNIKIKGGYAANEAIPSFRSINNYPTYLNGDILDQGELEDNTRVLVDIQGQLGIVFDGINFINSFSDPDNYTDLHGAIRMNSANVEFYHCRFMRNYAYLEPCVQATNSYLYFEGCYFTENYAQEGSLLSSQEGFCDVEMINCTTRENDLFGPVFRMTNNSSLDLLNTIVWENPNRELNSGSATVTTNHCIVSNTDGIDSAVETNSYDPLFSSFYLEDSYDLSCSSPAVNTGLDAVVTVSTDLNDFGRFLNGPVDIGCREVSSFVHPYDQYYNALPLSLDSDPIYGSFRCSEFQLIENSGCINNPGRGVWYSFEAPASGKVRVSTDFIDSETATLDLIHTIFSYQPGGNPELGIVDCANSSPTSFSDEENDFEGLTPGETYLVLVSCLDTQSGSYNISISNVPVPPVPGIVYVDADAPSGGDGSSWANAFDKLEEAIDDAAPGETIWLSEGYYYSNLAPQGNFRIDKKISIIGGFNGTETNVADSNPLVHESIIAANGMGSVFGNSMYIQDASDPVEITGVVFENNVASIGSGNFQAVFLIAPVAGAGTNTWNLIVNRCTFRNNSSELFGIGTCFKAVNFSLYEANVRIESCLFHNNDGSGPLIDMGNQNINLEIIGSTFADNSVTNGTKPFIQGADITTVANCVFWNNTINHPNFFETISTFEYNLHQGGNVPSGTGNLSSDPHFESISGSSYGLSPSSPCINAGDSDLVDHIYDLGKQQRVQQEEVDLGCFETEFIPQDTCPQDLNNDGVISTGDLTVLLTDFGCQGICSADINSDGLVNTTDLASILNVFGGSCSGLN